MQMRAMSDIQKSRNRLKKCLYISELLIRVKERKQCFVQYLSLVVAGLFVELLKRADVVVDVSRLPCSDATEYGFAGLHVESQESSTIGHFATYLMQDFTKLLQVLNIFFHF